MSGKYLGGCEKAAKALDLGEIKCCNSCHEDADEYGYEMCHIYIGSDWYEVCCSVSVAVKDPKESK
jgi:hypothetical protein